MKQLRSTHILILLLVMLVLKSPGVSGQRSPFDPDVYREASIIKEYVEVFTDRSIYAVNENINFRADLVVEGLPESKRWSSILYVELVSNTGTSLTRAKYDLSDQVCYGMLSIPAGALTGNYFLKCYTRWMRNAGPGNFSYTPLKIINPYRPEVVNQTRGRETGLRYSRRDYITGLVECAIPKTCYERGEEISLELSVPTNTHLQKVQCCITVVPLDAVDTLKGQLTSIGELVDRDQFAVQFLPDLYGPSISGAVVRTDENDGPVKNTKLHFSLLGDRPDYFATVTDAFGKFVVSIPARTGLQELIVTPEIPGDGFAEVRIDQDFDTDFPLIPAVPFTLSSGEHEIATQMVRRMQLSEAFKRPDPPEAVRVNPAPVSFYGTAIHSIVLDDFIDLPTLEEVFINLVSSVTVVKRKNSATLMIHSDNPTSEFYDPLIMVDQISVFDHDKLMSIAPEKIRRIDVINDVYVKGSMTYSGVINIVTREGNMAGIDLSAGSYFFDYLAIQPVNSPIERITARGDQVPDTRNTLLWIPDLVLERSMAKEIVFKAPAYPGEYVVLVRCIARPGEILSVTARFLVK
ncbi:MAG: hypothetical protein J7K53_02390 [Bacteroidales bacterium]|nr:hypothetical protein [Bacteroidales bacterium]